MKFVPASQQIIRERARNAALVEELNKSKATMDYIAMMCDVDLGDDDTDGDEGAREEGEAE